MQKRRPVGRHRELDEEQGIIDLLGVWESLNNPSFNSLEFEGIERQAGRNSFAMSPRK